MAQQPKKGKIAKLLDNEKSASNIDFGDEYEEELIEEAQREAAAKHATEKQELETTSPDKGKLKQFFIRRLGIDFIKDQIPKTELQKTEEHEPREYIYWQMELDLEKYGEEFEHAIEQAEKAGVKVRRATESDKDLESVARLYNRAFMKGQDPWSPINKEQVRKIMNYGNTCILIASVNDVDVAFIILDLEGPNKEVGVICGLGTDPAWRRRGYARYLGLVAWHYLKKMNVKKLKCEVYEKNYPSRRLIESLYFKKVGENVYVF